MVIGTLPSRARIAAAVLHPASPAPTITMPAPRCAGMVPLAAGARCCGVYGSKSALVTPQSGQTQSSLMSAKRVPGGRPLSSSPKASS